MKRTLSSLLAFFMVMACCLGVASATDVTPFASLTIAMKSAEALPGSDVGEVEIAYTVVAKGSANKCGVSSIKIYEKDGTHVATITGTIANGLLVSGASHMGSYFYDGESGVSYYAEVTVYAGNSSTSDSKTITTGIATAP